MKEQTATTKAANTAVQGNSTELSPARKAWLAMQEDKAAHELIAAASAKEDAERTAQSLHYDAAEALRQANAARSSAEKQAAVIDEYIGKQKRKQQTAEKFCGVKESMKLRQGNQRGWNTKWDSEEHVEAKKKEKQRRTERALLPKDRPKDKRTKDEKRIENIFKEETKRPLGKQRSNGRAKVG